MLDLAVARFYVILAIAVSREWVGQRPDYNDLGSNEEGNGNDGFLEASQERGFVSLPVFSSFYIEEIFELLLGS